MIGYSGDIQTAGFQQNLLNKIKYGGQFFFHDYSVILELGPLSKDNGFCFCKKQTTTTTNEGKRKGRHPFCRLLPIQKTLITILREQDGVRVRV